MTAVNVIRVLEQHKNTKMGLAIQERAGVDFDNLTLCGLDEMEKVISEFIESFSEIHSREGFKLVMDKEGKEAITAHYIN